MSWGHPKMVRDSNFSHIIFSSKKLLYEINWWLCFGSYNTETFLLMLYFFSVILGENALYQKRSHSKSAITFQEPLGEKS